MAKYNAIYEGRLPHDIRNKISCDNDLAVQRRPAGGMTAFFNNIYKQVIDFFAQESFFN